MKSVFYSLGMIFQASGLVTGLYPCFALFSAEADLRQMMYVSAFGGGLFLLGWLLTRASR